MKKLLVVIAMVSMMVLGGATLAMAYPNHVSLAWVDPNTPTQTHNVDGTISGTADYTILIESGNANFVGVDTIYVEFEFDVFKNWAVVAGSSIPAGWTFSVDPGTGTASFARGTSGTALTVGQTMTFSATYTIWGDPDTLSWDEAHRWGQAVTTWEVDSDGDGLPDGSHGTSTEEIPEPATALLFGSGMALIGYLRKK